MAITLTERAAQRVRKFLGADGARYLRLGVTRSGCSGFSYVLEFTEAPGENDEVFESQGVKVVVDRDQLPYIDGTELDYTKEGLNEAFRFHNPQAQAYCGCGTSFSVAGQQD